MLTCKTIYFKSYICPFGHLSSLFLSGDPEKCLSSKYISSKVKWMCFSTSQMRKHLFENTILHLWDSMEFSCIRKYWTNKAVGGIVLCSTFKHKASVGNVEIGPRIRHWKISEAVALLDWLRSCTRTPLLEFSIPVTLQHSFRIDGCRETVPKVRKMKTPFYIVCDRGNGHEYFETFPSLLGAKLIEMEQFEITGENNYFEEKREQNFNCIWFPWTELPCTKRSVKMQTQDLITLYGDKTGYHTLNKRSVLFSPPL